MVNKTGPTRRPSTIIDVASAANVSIATVSRVLNHPEIVNEQTRRHVMKAIDTLNYKPSKVASSLKTGLYHSVAALVGDVAQPWYSMMIKALGAFFEGHGYNVQLYDLNHDVRRLVGLLGALQHDGVDAAIVSTGDNLQIPGVLRGLKRLNASGMPLVIAGPATHSPIPSIVYDDKKGAADATRYLLSTYGGTVVYLGTTGESTLSVERRLGFNAAMQAAGHDPGKWAFDADGYRYEAGYLAMQEIIKGHTTPRSVLAANDQLALGVMRALQEQGTSIPAEVAVMGFGDTDFAPFVNPSLSSVRGSVDDIAIHAGECVLALIRGEPVRRSSVIKRDVVIRESA